LANINFSKAFDSVWHSALFHKLLTLGLPPCFVHWTRSYLSDRKAKVLFRGARSRLFRIRRGVPQGSILGPALFTLYIHDIAKSLPQRPSTHSMLMISPSGLPPLTRHSLKAAYTVQEALDHLEEWSLKWRFSVNPATCKCCFFSTDLHQASHQPQLTLTGTRLHSTPPPSSSVLLLTEPSPLVRMTSPFV